MPLPPALLQRLAKRGIIDKPRTNSKVRKTHQHPSKTVHNEEIIAENYDDDEPTAGANSFKPAVVVDERENDDPYDYETAASKPPENFWSERLKRRIVDANATAGYRGCPNKYNIYHKCTLYCMNTFGDGIAAPSREYSRRQQRLVRRYPLPRDWKEVWDNGCGVHYYWNISDDSVSWLPPSHPNAVIGKAAAVQRRELDAVVPDLDDVAAGAGGDEPNMTINIEGMNIELPIPAAMLLPDRSTSHQQPQREREGAGDASMRAPPPSSMPRKPKARDLEKTISRSRSDRRKRGADITGKLDPMDPAAYSDIPRGKWSAGLDRETEKTGVDTTAGGALYQMRPYPSPGAIMAAQGQKRQNDVDGDGGSDDEA